MERLAAWSLPLVRPGGEVLAMKGSTAAAEVERAAAVISDLGGRDVRIETVGEAWVRPPVTVVAVLK
jgi:16S rRNA (guanine527-N7)-methyltransferase